MFKGMNSAAPLSVDREVWVQNVEDKRRWRQERAALLKSMRKLPFDEWCRARDSGKQGGSKKRSVKMAKVAAMDVSVVLVDAGQPRDSVHSRRSTVKPASRGKETCASSHLSAFDGAASAGRVARPSMFR